MRPPLLEAIVNDLRKDQDVTAPLKRVFSLSDKDFPRVRRLEFTKRIMNEVANKHSKHAHQAFLEAIASLRDLAPFLKRAEQSFVYTIANVEKHSVNHASQICFENQSEAVDLLPSVSRLMEDALKRIFDARVSAPSRARRKTQPQTERSENFFAKENENPQLRTMKRSGCIAPADVSDDCFFKGGLKLDKQALLPRKDSKTVATVVSGAIVVKLSLGVGTVTLSELLTLAKEIAIPWVDYLQSLTKESEAHHWRICVSYRKRIQAALLTASRREMRSPVIVLRARVYALSLTDMKLNQYARDLLCAAHNFIRGMKTEKLTAVYDIVGSVYEDALQHAMTFSMSDYRWFSEDVSAWLDHVAVVWALRSLSKPTPILFAKRVSALNRVGDEVGILESCELQQLIIKLGLYAAQNHAHDSTEECSFSEAAFEAIEEQIQEIPMPSLTELAGQHGKRVRVSLSWREAERYGLRRLRLMRVLEPIRKSVVSCGPRASSIPRGALLVLETCIKALLDGLLALETVRKCSESEGRQALEELRSRLDRMIGACVEAGREISRHLFDENEFASLGLVVHAVNLLIMKLKRNSPDKARKWKDWIASFFHRRLQACWAAEQECSIADNFEKLSSAARFAELCSTLWYNDVNGDTSCDVANRGLLEAARGCYTLIKDWPNAARISLKMLSMAALPLSMERRTSEMEMLQKLGRDFAGDLALAFISEGPVELCLESGCPVEFLLSVIMDYCSFVKESHSQLYQKRFDIMHSLQRARRIMLKLVAESSSLVFCSQRQLHLNWVSFTSQASLECSAKDIDAFSALQSKRRPRRCQGHLHSESPAAIDYRQVECSTEHDCLVSHLSKSIVSVSEGCMPSIEEGLLTVQSLLVSSDSLSKDVELMHICAEITEWSSAVCATSGFEQVSSLAYEISKVARTNLGISASGASVLDSFRHLNTLGLRREGAGFFHPTFDKGNEGTRASGRVCDVHGRPNSSIRIQDAVKRGRILEEDTLDSLQRAQQRMKKCLLPFMNSTQPNRSSVPKQPHQLSGANIEISFDVRSEFGQTRLCNLLGLVGSLFDMGNLLLIVENLTDGRYYLEQCLFLSSTCMSEDSSFSQFISTQTLVAKSTTGFLDQPSQEQFLEVISRHNGEDDAAKDGLSKAVAIQAVCVLGLEQLSNRFTNHLNEPIGNKLFKMLANSESILNRNPCCEKCSLSLSDGLKLCKGLVHVFMQNGIGARDNITELLEDQGEAPRSTALTCSYVTARSFIIQAGGLDTIIQGLTQTLPTPRRGTSRVLRSRAKKKVTVTAPGPTVTCQKVLEVLTRIEPKATAGYFCPQFCRRIWNLRGFLENETDAVLLSLVRSIGCTFDLRWGFSVNEKARRIARKLPGRNAIDGLEDSFRQMSLLAPSDFSSDIDIAQVQKRLVDAGCVVVGLSVDESMKYIVVWRICAGAAMTKRILLPESNETSLLGIKRRINDVIIGMKTTSVKAGQILDENEKEKWWKDRYRLDSEVKNIVSDIESEWFGDSRMLLIPSMFDRVALNKEVQAGDCSFSESLLRLSHAAFPELSSDASRHQQVQDHSSYGVLPGDVSIGELVLVVDSTLEQIPWESLPIFRQLSIAVTRAPSVRFLVHHLSQSYDAIDPRSVYYVVNPDGDLRRTEETFKERQEFSVWSGSFGKVSREEVSAGYNDEQVYLYCGHGAGDLYLSPRKFSKQTTAPIALLMGCSSARPDNVGMSNCESNGSAIDYLVHGSRAVVGNLWDVGDKDIDRFTTSLISDWLGMGNSDDTKSEANSLAESVAVARSACRLPYLVGAASIILGAPQIWAETGTFP